MAISEMRWGRVVGITFVQGAVTLCWVIYNLYLPILLVQWGFSAQLAGGLLMIENALEAVIEPWAGNISDQTQQFLGTRLPFILAGVIVSSALFIAFPAVMIFDNPGAALRWLLPTLAIIWAIAMATFRTPTISLLTLASPKVELPIAVSVLTFIQQLIGSLRFSAYGLILSLSAPFAFALGTAVLLGAITCLRWVTPPEMPIRNTAQSQAANFPWSVLLFFIGTAISLAWGLRFMMAAIAGSLKVFLGEQTPWGMVGFSIAIAFMALPAGELARWCGNRVAMLGGISVTVIVIPFLVTRPTLLQMGMSALLLSFAFSLILNGAIPFVLSFVPQQRAGLAVGSYFGAFGAGMSLFDWLIAPADAISVTGKATFSAIAFTIAGGVILSSYVLPTIRLKS